MFNKELEKSFETWTFLAPAGPVYAAAPTAAAGEEITFQSIKNKMSSLEE